MENLLERTRTQDMYRQVFVPDKRNNVITIPSKLYGRKIEVIVLPALMTSMRTKQPRKNWALAAQQMHIAGDDRLLIPTELNNDNIDW